MTAIGLHNAVIPAPVSGGMPILTIRNVPDDLYQKLKLSATDRGRSMNSEVIECLREALASRRPRQIEGFLDRARSARERLRARGIVMDVADVDEAKRWGRE